MKKNQLPAPEYFLRRACELGAIEAKILSPKQVYTAEWVRRKCQYGCDGYGEHLTCPPFSPTPQETQRMLNEYTTALLIHCPSHGIDTLEIISALEREAFLSGYYKAFGFSAGPCPLCDHCNVEKTCCHTEQARPSMEACGIDVYKTARDNGFPIEVVRTREDERNIYGVILVE
jgi:predicted metal-binding protein